MKKSELLELLRLILFYLYVANCPKKQMVMFPESDEKDQEKKNRKQKKHQQELRDSIIRTYQYLSKIMNCYIGYEKFIKYSGFSEGLFYNRPHAIFRTFTELKEAARNKK